MAPEYLRHLVPPIIQSTTIYPLRNGDNLIVPFCRLSITNSSFIPSTVKEWNKLDIAIRKLDSLSKFKSANILYLLTGYEGNSKFIEGSIHPNI